MSPCEAYAALLDAFLDGELTPEQAADVQRHLEDCPACRAYADDVFALRAALPDAEEVELPADFTATVMEAVKRAPQSRPKRQPWGKLAAAAACLALIVLLQKVGLPRSAFKAAGSSAAPAAAAADAAPMALLVGQGAQTESAAAYDLAESVPEESGAPSALETNGAEAKSGSTASPASPPLPVEGAEDAQEELRSEARPAALTLRPEGAELLADYEPVEETDTEARYELTGAQYAALLKILPKDVIVPPILPVRADENVFVLLLK